MEALEQMRADLKAEYDNLSEISKRLELGTDLDEVKKLHAQMTDPTQKTMFQMHIGNAELVNALGQNVNSLTRRVVLMEATQVNLVQRVAALEQRG